MLLSIWLLSSFSIYAYKKQVPLTLCLHLGSPSVFGGVSVAHHFWFLGCVVFLFCLVRHVVSCVPTVASVSGLFILDCLFSFFSSVYLHRSPLNAKNYKWNEKPVFHPVEIKTTAFNCMASQWKMRTFMNYCVVQ